MTRRKGSFLILALAAGAAPLACAQSYNGFLDYANCSSIAGWAWDSTQPGTPISVDLWVGPNSSTRTTFVTTLVANQYRSDLNTYIGNGNHGYNYPTPPSLKDGQTHYVFAYFGGTSTPLNYNGVFSLNVRPGRPVTSSIIRTRLLR